MEEGGGGGDVVQGGGKDGPVVRVDRRRGWGKTVCAAHRRQGFASGSRLAPARGKRRRDMGQQTCQARLFPKSVPARRELQVGALRFRKSKATTDGNAEAQTKEEARIGTRFH